MRIDPLTSRERFEGGFNCSQAILARFGPAYGVDEETAHRLGAGLGGGFGNLGRTCGAVSAACLVLGLRFASPAIDHENAARVNAIVRTFVRRFEERHGTAMCRGLIRHDIREPAQLDTAVAAGAFAPCPGYVESAEALLREILDEDGTDE